MRLRGNRTRGKYKRCSVSVFLPLGNNKNSRDIINTETYFPAAQKERKISLPFGSWQSNPLVLFPTIFVSLCSPLLANRTKTLQGVCPVERTKRKNENERKTNTPNVGFAFAASASHVFDLAYANRTSSEWLCICHISVLFYGVWRHWRSRRSANKVSPMPERVTQLARSNRTNKWKKRRKHSPPNREVKRGDIIWFHSFCSYTGRDVLPSTFCFI